MKFFTETLMNSHSVQVELDESTGKKNYFIEGIFLQSEQKNRNGRVYPKSVLKKEVERYTKESIETKRSIGELNHPDNPRVNPERASHLIVSLTESGNDYIGKAKILNTPVGNIVKGLLEDGVSLGVSSRGLGTLKESNGVNVVQDDYYMSTIDIVSDPSAPSAFVNGIMEGVEWIYENGIVKPKEIEVIKDAIEDEYSKVKVDEKVFVEMFEEFINKLK